MDTSDDFDLLAKAVARVLRESFAVAADVRANASKRIDVDERALDEHLERIFAEATELAMRAQRRQYQSSAAFDVALASTRREVEEVMSSAVAEAEAIRAQAVADARAIIDGAQTEVSRAQMFIAEERTRLDAELKDLVRTVHRSVSALERSAHGDHDQLLQRATSEAQMILRQARLHHRLTAREVDRMIEAAACEAAALRSSALSDAARVAARVRGVVDFEATEEPSAPAQLRPVAS